MSKLLITLGVITAALMTVSTAQPLDPLRETRYCGAPVRTASGDIRRRADVLAAFRREHPCPSTQQVTGTCPGWQINHVIPLACGGCDAVSNLQWLPTDIKTGPGPHAVDRFERRIGAASEPIPGTPACKNEVVL